VPARKPRRPGPILQLHISLQDIEPPIWRRVLVHDTMSLANLHSVIQEAFGWQDYHLFAFVVAGKRYEGPSPDAEGADATRVALKKLPLEPGTGFEYVYDFGDDWHHTVLVEQRLTRDRDGQYPVCLDGERAGPPEDCGGPPGYANLLRALGDPGDPEHPDLVVWAGPWAPEAFDLRATNRILQLAFPTRAV